MRHGAHSVILVAMDDELVQATAPSPPSDELDDLGEIDPPEPLDGTEEPEDQIPPAPLWAMKDRMHGRRLTDPDDPGHIYGRVGSGGSALYFCDDGNEHCMVGRRVGQSPDKCVYCLVARVGVFAYEQLRDGEIAARDVFADARDIAVCGVFEDQGASNVMAIQHYRRSRSIPEEYLPPNPFIEFADADGDPDSGDPDSDDSDSDSHSDSEES